MTLNNLIALLQKKLEEGVSGDILVTVDGYEAGHSTLKEENIEVIPCFLGINKDSYVYGEHAECDVDFDDLTGATNVLNIGR